MRYLVVVLLLCLLFSMSLVGLIYSRKDLVVQLNKTSYLEMIKNRVTTDMLKELQASIAEASNRMEETKKQVKDLEPAAKAAQEDADRKTSELNTCNEELNKLKTEVSAVDTEREKTESEFQQQKTTLSEQKNNLTEETQKRSKVCSYILKTSPEGMKLCGIVPVLQAENNPPPKAA